MAIDRGAQVGDTWYYRLNVLPFFGKTMKAIEADFGRLHTFREELIKSRSVIPAEAGIQNINALDTGFRRCDGLLSVSLG